MTKPSYEELRIDEAFVESVEDTIGMGRGAWDMVDAKELCEAVLKTAHRESRDHALEEECPDGSKPCRCLIDGLGRPVLRREN